MKLLNGRIFIMTPIGSATHFLTLIVFFKRLRRTIFHAYHTTTMGAHMKRYKTLLIIQARFFWPAMGKDLFEWVRRCARYIPANARI